MTNHVKIALNVSRDIPFSQLVLSQANVRRVKAGVSIDTLAADIARRGLLQSLSVRPQRDVEGNETGLFEVPAGGRRFRALQQLVKGKRMVKTQPVPCIVRDDAEISAEEDSLAENTHREALQPQRTVISIGGAAASMVEEEDEQEDLLKPLPDRLVTELTTHRTLALRDAVAAHPTVAFAAVLHAFVLETFYRYTQVESCMEVSIRGGSLSVHAPSLNDSISAQAIERRHDAWKERLPDDAEQLWDALIAFDGDDQSALFAHCASFGINAVWEPGNRYNDGRVSPHKIERRIANSHIVARAADLDMVGAGWSAGVNNYLGRVTKARIVAAVEEASRRGYP